MVNDYCVHRLKKLEIFLQMTPDKLEENISSLKVFSFRNTQICSRQKTIKMNYSSWYYLTMARAYENLPFCILRWSKIVVAVSMEGNQFVLLSNQILWPIKISKQFKILIIETCWALISFRAAQEFWKWHLNIFWNIRVLRI